MLIENNFKPHKYVLIQKTYIYIKYFVSDIILFLNLSSYNLRNIRKVGKYFS